MNMTIAELTKTITDLQDLRRMQDELTSEIEALQDAIKAAMGDDEVITAGPWRVTYRPVTSTRIDTTALRRELPDVAARYSKTTTTRRFTVV